MMQAPAINLKGESPLPEGGGDSSTEAPQGRPTLRGDGAVVLIAVRACTVADYSSDRSLRDQQFAMRGPRRPQGTITWAR